MPQRIYYTAIGSRKAPRSALDKAGKISFSFAKKSIIMRSGAAQGMDTAFDLGCWRGQGEAEIYVPWKSFDRFPYITKHREVIIPNYEQGAVIARRFHPVWDKLTLAAKKLHARNAYQVLGQDLKTPSLFVVCWTPNGETVGGTATAIKIAMQHGIPVFNIASPLDIIKLYKFAGERLGF